VALPDGPPAHGCDGDAEEPDPDPDPDGANREKSGFGYPFRNPSNRPPLLVPVPTVGVVLVDWDAPGIGGGG
jgi:hypothetical protein